uniref:Laminin, beta 3 n=1 Tax=Sphaeramia orbicularis TaxID=375764 RepID=A0A673A471_9TELE
PLLFFLLFFFLPLLLFLFAQDVCSLGACYPPSGDLLLGRSQRLQASSTCGLMGSEVYCTPYQQRRMKCCPCDSRNPDSQLAHTVQDVLSTAGPDRWWQSRKGVSPVTLQLDLGNLFQLDNLVLSFKGPRPSALVIEKTEDGGRTWQPAVYMATDCHRAFPGVSTTTPLTLDQTYCYTLPPTGGNPYQDHTVWKTHTTEEKKTNNRILSKENVPRLPGRALSQFYALKEMRVMGRCMCHGHAHRCLPETHNNLASNGIQVNPQCDCQHNTAGVNCERCADLYNDLPWRPAEEDHTHTCKRCECNNHAQRCRFDPVVFEASGRTSGGVCENCMHHTTGPKCDRCAAGYQPNPRSPPVIVAGCVCSADGTVNGSGCEDVTGSCRCKANVDGPRCERCKSGFYGLNGADPLGCSKCSCSPDGSLSDVCDPVTGQCLCRPHFHGRTCNTCAKGFWKPIGSTHCKACGCDATNSLSDACDQSSGQCQCRPGFGGRTCAGCADGAFGDPLIGCQLCRCNLEGTIPEVCDKLTGACQCRPGVTGTRCDSCGRERCSSFPDCPSCPSCFFTLDAQMQNLSSVLNGLSVGFPAPPGGSGDPGNFGPRIHALESSLNRIRNSIHLPPDTLNVLMSLSGTFNTIKDAYKESKDAANKVDATKDTVQQSADVREDALNLRNQVQLPNIRDLNKLNHSMASGPNLTPVAKQVCGSLRSEPCTPLQCDGGDFCPPEGTPPCEKGKKCIGALPLSKWAMTDAQDVKERLDRLTQKIREADRTNQVRDSAGKLNNRVKKARHELEGDLTDTRNVVKELKDFLSGRIHQHQCIEGSLAIFQYF